MTALHLHGTFLPDEEPRDFWIAHGVLTDQPVAGAQTIARDAWVIPGLVDAHSHVGLGVEGDVGAERARAHAVADLSGGTMLIRDNGSQHDSRWMHSEDDLPRLLRSGRHIARPKRYIRNLGVEVEPERLVEQVRHEARSGDGWIKLVGDWIDRSVGDLAPLWPADVAAEAIAAAHDEGARVTAHCFGEQAVAELVAAGIDCIEHGTGLTADVIDQMVANGTALVPTMINLDLFPFYAEPAQEKFPTYYAHMMDLHARRRETRRGSRSTQGPTPAPSSSMGASRMRSTPSLRLPAPITPSPPPVGARVSGWGPKASWPAPAQTSSCSTPTPGGI